LRIALLIALPLLVQGCLLSRIEFSQARLPAVADVSLEVIPYNASGGPAFFGPVPPLILPPLPSLSRSFRIEVRVRPRDPAQGFAFDARRVTLRTGNGRLFSVRRVLGPVGGVDCARPRGNRDRPSPGGFPAHLGSLRIPTKPIPFTETACFFVEFDVKPVPPSEQFALVIDGLLKGDQPITIPPIYFEGSSTWERDVL